MIDHQTNGWDDERILAKAVERASALERDNDELHVQLIDADAHVAELEALLFALRHQYHNASHALRSLADQVDAVLDDE